MKTKFFTLVAIVFFGVYSLFAQTSAKKQFEEFLEKNTGALQESYEKKDIITYAKIFEKFSSLYELLPTETKKEHTSTKVSANYAMASLYAVANNKKAALELLQKSIQNDYGAGYYIYNDLTNDPDLTNIRNEPEFKAILAKAKEIGDHLSTLKKADKYNLADNRPVPAFSYQSSNNPSLVALRKKFSLDSIAGKGNEVLRILNLLHWVHNLILHDGIHGNPDVLNAMNMITICKKENRGLNCRGLAIVLNECYLALGIKSRIVTCYPKDSLKIDQDCHVITMVYSETLKKWLWIDPTFNAYVMNEKGDLLSIEEVRERLIMGNPLILNPDAEWNNQTQQTKKNYLETYMAKNLYILECSVTSEYNMETMESGKNYTYIRLLPLDYKKQTTDKSEEKNEKTNTTWITYNTNNTKTFWEH